MANYIVNDVKWGSNGLNYYEIEQEENILIFMSEKQNMFSKDICVAIKDGYKLKALAVVSGNSVKKISDNEDLKIKIINLGKKQTKDSEDIISNACYIEADFYEFTNDVIEYKNRKSTTQILKKEITTELDKIFKEIMNEEFLKQYIDLLTNSHNIILHGAPGTGKTYLAKQIAKAMEAETEFVQFHPSYDYTDFVEGLRPVNKEGSKEIGFERKDGIFKTFCQKALENLIDSQKNEEQGDKKSETKEKKFVFIIDEINRGEMSKIFGELFFSIDPGYRGEKGKISTQYQNLVDEDDAFYDGFYVPENVYIIGTMNDIDRNVESMDFAIRRRFAFMEIEAEYTKESILANMPNKDKLIKCMDNLNNAIWNETENKGVEGLSSAYHIGAAYFLKYDSSKDEATAFDELWNYHLKPLLQEYLRGMEGAEQKLKDLEAAYNKVFKENKTETDKKQQ